MHRAELKLRRYCRALLVFAGRQTPTAEQCRVLAGAALVSTDTDGDKIQDRPSCGMQTSIRMGRTTPADQLLMAQMISGVASADDVCDVTVAVSGHGASWQAHVALLVALVCGSYARAGKPALCIQHVIRLAGRAVACGGAGGWGKILRFAQNDSSPLGVVAVVAEEAFYVGEDGACFGELGRRLGVEGGGALGVVAFFEGADLLLDVAVVADGERDLALELVGDAAELGEVEVEVEGFVDGVEDAERGLGVRRGAEVVRRGGPEAGGGELGAAAGVVEDADDAGRALVAAAGDAAAGELLTGRWGRC